MPGPWFRAINSAASTSAAGSAVRERVVQVRRREFECWQSECRDNGSCECTSCFLSVFNFDDLESRLN